MRVEKSSPTVPVEAEPVDTEPVDADLENARSVLEQFLEARWTLDRERALPLVASADRKNVWATAFEPRALQGPAVDRDALASWYQWEVESLQRRGDDRVVAVVEVGVPTLAEMSLRLDQIDLAVHALLDHETFSSDRRDQIDESFEPIRHIVPVAYELIRERGDWKVRIGWGEELDLEPGASQRSERWWLDRLHRQGLLTDEEERLVRTLKGAESFARLYRYDHALEDYKALLAKLDSPPVFVARRPAELESERKEWHELLDELKIELEVVRLEDADVADSLPFNSRYRPSSLLKDGNTLFEIRLHNRGEVFLKQVNFDVFGPNHRYGSDRIKTIPAGSVGRIAFEPKGFDDVDISEVELHITSVEPANPGLAEKYTPEDTHQYEWRFEDWLTDGATSTSTARLADKLRRRAAEFA
jgi:hypothetical protein